MPSASTILLVDNGSLEPAATLAIRELASALARKLGRPVAPVSLLHSSGVDPQALGGQPAEILLPALERRLAGGESDFLILPLFFGPSQALTVYLPENVARLRSRHPALRVRIAAPLDAAGDDRLGRILADRVCERLGANGADRVALVDHGSPVKAVTAVRDSLARQLASTLGARVAAVAPASMERRPGPDYDFAEPLLSRLLTSPQWNSGWVIVALQFLLPGRHAGPEGDVARICREAETSSPGLQTVLTGLVGDHPLLVDILADRCRAACL